MFQTREQGGLEVGPKDKGKGTEIMFVVDASGVRPRFTPNNARPAEVTPVQDTLEASFGLDFPERLVGHKADDGDGFRTELAGLGNQMIVPKHRKTPDGRPLRRNHQRWNVEPAVA